MNIKIFTDFPIEQVKEGKVKIFVPRLESFVESPSDYAPSKCPVFYNPVMDINRDIAVLALQTYQKMINRKITVCEPLAGCGIRSIRFATEVKGIEHVIINDINFKAYKLATFNVELNKLRDTVEVKNWDANFLLANYGAPKKRFDAIDIDPFGSPVPYLDAAIRALRRKGLLILTATDMAPLCGVHVKSCIRKYGGVPLRTEYCHELAIRLLIGNLATTAAKFDMGIKVLLSYCDAHYIRSYILIEHGAKKADWSINKKGYILHCFNCFHREPIKNRFSIIDNITCRKCGAKIDIAGPLWLGKIVDKKFCELLKEEAKKRIFNQNIRINKMLGLLCNEAEAPITYYVLDRLCKKLRMPMPPVKYVITILRAEGFKAFLTHFNTKGIKSNAPTDMMKVIILKTQKQKN